MFKMGDKLRQVKCTGFTFDEIGLTAKVVWADEVSFQVVFDIPNIDNKGRNWTYSYSEEAWELINPISGKDDQMFYLELKHPKIIEDNHLFLNKQLSNGEYMLENKSEIATHQTKFTKNEIFDMWKDGLDVSLFDIREV